MRSIPIPPTWLRTAPLLLVWIALGNLPACTPAESTYDDLVVSSAAAGGQGHSTVLRFDGRTGQLIGPFSAGTEIVDPRDIEHDLSGQTVYVNNGDDRVLRYNGQGNFLGPFLSYANLNPGASVFGPDGNYYVGARSLLRI